MSSYYTAAELEAMRKAEIRKALQAGINRMKALLNENRKSDIECIKSENVFTSVFKEDEIVSGIDEDLEVDISSIDAEYDDAENIHEELDFSALLEAIAGESKLVAELNAWFNKVDNRVVYRKKDEEDRTRLLKVLEEIIHNSDMDIEDKIGAVKMRVEAYLQGAYELTETEMQEIDDEYIEYVALCQMLDLTPRERFPYRIKTEIDRMRTVLEKRAEEECVMETIQEILAEMGYNLKDETVLERVAGRRFAVGENASCDVFVGSDGTGIMFEPIVKEEIKSTKSSEEIKKDVGHICSLYKELEERAFERGVILNRVYLEPIGVEQCASDSSVSTRKKKKRKTISQKLKALGQEG